MYLIFTRLILKVIMERITIEDLNCSELQQPTNDIALLPDNSTPTPSAPAPPPPPPPPLPEAIFGDNWQHLSINDFRARTRGLNDYVQAN